MRLLLLLTLALALAATSCARSLQAIVDSDAGAPEDGGEGLDARAPEGDAGSLDGGVGGSSVGPCPTLLYRSDFDSGYADFEPGPGGSPDGLTEAEPESYGGIFDEFWTPDLGDGDRAIAFFRSQSMDSIRWRFRHLNDTGEPIVAVCLRYDVEVAWARFQGREPEGAEYGVRTGRVDWWAPGERFPVSTSSDVTNLAIGEAEVERWLSRDEQDQLRVALRGVQHAFLLPVPVPAGEELTLEWGTAIITGSTERQLTIGIDDLAIGVSSSPVP